MGNLRVDLRPVGVPPLPPLYVLAIASNKTVADIQAYGTLGRT